MVKTLWIEGRTLKNQLSHKLDIQVKDLCYVKGGCFGKNAE